MFNQHHTHYMSSSKIIPCSCKGNVITSKSWETQWHECIDRKNKVCSRYLIFIWVWMFTTITSRALHIYEVRKTTPSESVSALLPQHCPGLKRCPQLPSVFKCENNSSWTTCDEQHPWHAKTATFDILRRRTSEAERMQTDCLYKNINSGRFK